MIGLIARLAAYVAIICGLVIEFADWQAPNLSGGLITGGAAVLLILAFRRAWITRGRMSMRDDD